MTIPQVPMASIIGMVVSLILCVGVPVLLCILVRKKYQGSWLGLLVGALTFMVVVMMLEQILHNVVFMAFGEVIAGNIWLYALYGALAAAVFEECGRYFAMKRILLKRGQLNGPGALMYGIGHGGIEAILVTGFTYVSNILTAFLINNGGIQSSLETLEGANRQAAEQSLEALGSTQSLMFYLGGVERVLALALQIALSILVYQAVKRGANQYLLAAFLVHFAVDFITVVLVQYLPAVAVEGILLVMVAAAGWFAYRLYRQEEQ